MGRLRRCTAGRIARPTDSMTQSLGGELNPGTYAPPFEHACLSLQHRVAAELDGGEPSRRHCLHVQHSPMAVDQRDVDREPHAHRVHMAARSQPDRPVDPVSPQQTFAPRLIGVCHLDVAHRATGHHENPHMPMLGHGARRFGPRNGSSGPSVQQPGRPTFDEHHSTHTPSHRQDVP